MLATLRSLIAIEDRHKHRNMDRLLIHVSIWRLPLVPARWGLKGRTRFVGPRGNLHVRHLVSTDEVCEVQEEEVTSKIIPHLASERASSSKHKHMGSIMKHSINTN